MKKLFFCLLAFTLCLATSVTIAQTAQTAAKESVVIDLDKIAAMSDQELQEYLLTAPEDTILALLKAVCDGRHKTLETRVINGVQAVISKMDRDKAQAFVARINSEIPSLNFNIAGDGSVTLFSIPLVRTTDIQYNIHSKTISKGASQF